MRRTRHFNSSILQTISTNFTANQESDKNTNNGSNLSPLGRIAIAAIGNLASNKVNTLLTLEQNKPATKGDLDVVYRYFHEEIVFTNTLIVNFIELAYPGKSKELINKTIQQHEQSKQKK